MHMDELDIKVRNVIADQFGVEALELKPETDIAEDLGADSLDVVELGLAFEEEFGLKQIPDEDVQNLCTVKDAVDYIRIKTTKAS